MGASIIVAKFQLTDSLLATRENPCHIENWAVTTLGKQNKHYY